MKLEARSSIWLGHLWVCPKRKGLLSLFSSVEAQRSNERVDEQSKNSDMMG